MRYIGILFFLSSTLFSQNILTKTNFPDPAFLSFLMNSYGTLTQSQADEILTISCNELSIRDLSGIKFFTNLETLRCANNLLVSLDELDQLQALKSLSAYGNQLIHLQELSDLSHIEYLAICCNLLTDLPSLEHLTSLKTLYIYDNQLTKTPAFPISLETLSFGENPLLAFPDLRKLHLSRLEIANLGLSRLPSIGGNEELVSLSFQNNSITEFPDLSAFPLLREIGAWNNHIAVLPDLSYLTELTTLYACCNDMTSINDLSGLTKLETLYLYSNELSHLPGIESLSHLKRLYLSDNQLETIPDLRAMSQLERLLISRNRIQNITPLIESPLGTQENHVLQIEYNLLSSEDCIEVMELVQRFQASGGEFIFQRQQNDFNMDCIMKRWIPHITRSGGVFETHILISNYSSEPGTIQLNAFDENGQFLESEVLLLAGNERYTNSLSQLFTSDAVSHLGILGSDEVVVTAGYKTSLGSGATAHCKESHLSGYEFWIYTGEWDIVFDGLALINIGEESSTVTITSFDGEGNQIAETHFDTELAPFAKQLAVFSDLLPEQTKLVRVTTTQPSMATFLRGTLPGFLPGFLYETTPVIVTP
jgi:Leucine-rich repeat (LRR) protein